MALTPLDVSAGQYLRQHGQRSVSAVVRRFVSHPVSVRGCGTPLAALTPLVVGGDGVGSRLLSLRQCRNRFVDPYCSGWFRAGLAERVAEVLRAALADGRACGMIVLTTWHKRGQSLRSVLDWQRRAWSQLLADRSLRKGLSLDWLACVDVIVGGPNGPHPHLNIPFIAGAGVSFDQVSARFRRAWVRKLLLTRKVQGDTPKDLRENLVKRSASFTPILDGNVDALAAYSTRHVDQSSFEAVDDRHRKATAPGGFSLLELACMAHSGQEAAGSLLGACSADLMGRRSWTASQGWKDRMRVDDAVEDEKASADVLQVGGFVTGLLPFGGWSKHRQQVEDLLDVQRGAGSFADCLADWRALDDRLSLGINWLAEPVDVAEWLDRDAVG